jgi:AcrR family transcriptional regulator
MPYEVTKHIKGHDYRYQVVSYRDPQSRKVKQNWTYVGRIDGSSGVAARKPRSDTRERIIGAILQLLDTRDLAHITIDVIIRTAFVSRGTFYRYFPDKSAALTASVETAFSEIRRTPRTLDGPLGTVETERQRLRAWIDEIIHHSVRSSGIHRAIAASPELRKARREQGELSHQAVFDTIVRYVRRLQAAGLVKTDDPDCLAFGVVCIINGFFKRVVIDGATNLEAQLLDGTVELLVRGLFGAGVTGETTSTTAVG